MSAYWLDIALICSLILLNAVFAGSEMALISLRAGQLRQELCWSTLAGFPISRETWWSWRDGASRCSKWAIMR